MKNPLASLLPGRAANPQSSPTTKHINLALQGGGAHGAFTWGVLEHLLSDERLVVRGHFWHVRGSRQRGDAGRRNGARRA